MSDYTALLLIIDRSGSMSSIKRPTEDGLNSLLREQAALPGKCTVDIVYFDDVFSYPVSMADPARQRVNIEPRNYTALYDSIVMGTTQFKQKIDALATPPSFVQVVVATDGQENASKVADALLVRDTIQFHTDVHGWDYTFLGSDSAAIADAAKLGFEGKKTMQFANSASGVSGMTTGLSQYIAATRRGEDAGYSDDDRQKAVASH